MKVSINPDFGGIGIRKEIEVPNGKCVYKQDYDGAEYIIYSDTPIYTQETTRINGEWITKWVELNGRIKEESK